MIKGFNLKKLLKNRKPNTIKSTFASKWATLNSKKRNLETASTCSKLTVTKTSLAKTTQRIHAARPRTSK